MPDSLNRNVFDLMRRLRDMNDTDYLQYLIAYHAAPILQGIKPATLLCPAAGDRDLTAALPECGKKLKAAFDVELAEFRNPAGAMLLLAYRPELLGSTLAAEEVVALLEEIGYRVPAATGDLLAHLRQKCAEPRFPHEIGVFLGYPPHDVKCFMEGNRCGGRAECWRAFHDHAAAQRRSDRFRRAKQRAAELIVGGADLAALSEGLRLGA